MSFIFPLEGLLRVRRLLESQARERLDESMMRVRSLEHSLSEAQAWYEKSAAILGSQSSLPACELQFADSVLRQAREAMRQCELRKAAEGRQAAELRNTYLEIRRARKTIGTLRENAWRQFQVEQARRAQSAMDETFLRKLIYSRTSNRDAADSTFEPGSSNGL